jgi:small subunit ribosomal protein S7
MPRRRSVNFQREIGVDPRFQSPFIQKFINVLMERGKKTVARGIVYDAMDVISKRIKGDENKSLDLFHRAFDNVIPAIEVRPKRVGGSVYQIPMEVPIGRARSLAMRWVIDAASARSDKTMSQRLAYELLDALEQRGGAVKKKNDVHRQAESNRAFSHFAW